MPQLTRVSRFGLVNGYLVEEEDGLTLIDTMLPRSGKVVLAKADELGRPIVRIALTHAHTDHVGSLDELASQLPDAEVSISVRDARFLAGDNSLDPEEEQLSKLHGSFSKRKTKPHRTLAAGDRVGSLEVIASPGHTPGHIAFLDTRDRTLYCGDTFSTLGGVATSAKPYPRFPLVGFGTWHRQTELESARALRALDPGRLAPGHGKVVEAPAAAMDEAIAKVS